MFIKYLLPIMNEKHGRNVRGRRSEYWTRYTYILCCNAWIVAWVVRCARVKRRVTASPRCISGFQSKPREQNYAYGIFQWIELYCRNINIMRIKMISSSIITDCFWTSKATKKNIHYSRFFCIHSPGAGITSVCT